MLRRTGVVQRHGGDRVVMPDLELDIATVVLRIEQAAVNPSDAEWLLDRMATCDAPRLRRHLSAEMLERMDATARAGEVVTGS